MRFVAVHIPQFPVAAALRAEPGLHASALAILEGEAPLERVAALNSAAQALGLGRGMSKVQAGLAGAVCFRARSVAEEQAALAAAWAVVERFSPHAQTVAGPLNGYGGHPLLALALLLDRGGTDALLGEARTYAQNLADALLAVRLPAHIAVTPNAEASLMLARSCPGVTTVSGGALTPKLAGLPVVALPCGAEALAVLEHWGIRTVGELAALPEDALVDRLGQGGGRLRRLALGVEERLLVPQKKAWTLLERAALDTPVSLLDALLFVLSPMLERLVQQATERACALRSVTLTLELEKGAPHAITVRPATPSGNREQLLKLLYLRLQADPPRAAVVALALGAESALPPVAQRGLFQAQFPDSGKLDVLLARLKAIAGEGCVGSPRLVNSHSEELFRMAPFEPDESPLAVQAGQSATSVALRRYRPPEPAQVVVRLGTPRLVLQNGMRLEVASAAGPWRSNGSWWDESRWDADEWDVVTTEPLQALRLRYERGANAWYVAGVYD